MPETFETWQLVLLLPTVVAGLGGFFLGWLRWRYRHVEVAHDEWDDLVAARQEYLFDVKEQRDKVEALKSAAESANGRAQAAEAKMAELHAQRQGAVDQLRLAVGERDAYRREFEVVVADLEQVSASRDKLVAREDQARAVVSQHEKARRRIASMSTEIDYLKDQLRLADLRAAEVAPQELLRSELARSQESLRVATSTISSLSSELAELKRRTDPLSAEAQEHKGQLAAANHRLLELESLLGDAAARIGQLETDLADAQHQAAHKSAVISSMEAELAGAAASADNLRSQLGSAIGNSAELAGAKNELELNSQRVRELATELAAEREQVILLQGQLAGAEARAEQLVARLGVESNVVDLRPDSVSSPSLQPQGPDWPPAN